MTIYGMGTASEIIEKTVHVKSAPTETSYQPAHPCCLIGALAVRIKMP